MTRLAQRKSRFGPITIDADKRSGAIAYCQGGYFQSRADRNGVSLLTYVHALFGLVRQTRAQTVLVIGCAGGSLATMLAREACDVTAVDVNPHAFLLARKYFGLPDSVQCRVADGCDFVFSSRRKFDAIVLDAFHGGRMPSDLLADSFFAQARKRLQGQGTIFANIHVADDRDDAADRGAERMREISPHLRILDRPGEKYRNAIVMAGAVRGLRKPSLLMPPDIESREIAAALGNMHLRTWKAR